MGQTLGKYYKTPTEVLDYDVDYTDWFANRSDAPATASVTALPADLTVSVVVLGTFARVTASGGTSGVSYEVTVVQLTTGTPQRRKEAKFTVVVN